MRIYCIIKSKIVSDISFNEKSAFFWIKTEKPVFLNISCICWNQNVIDCLKSFKKEDIIEMKCFIKSNNLNLNFKCYELIVNEVKLDNNWVK